MEDFPLDDTSLFFYRHGARKGEVKWARVTQHETNKGPKLVLWDVTSSARGAEMGEAIYSVDAVGTTPRLVYWNTQLMQDAYKGKGLSPLLSWAVHEQIQSVFRGRTAYAKVRVLLPSPEAAGYWIKYGLEYRAAQVAWFEDYRKAAADRKPYREYVTVHPSGLEIRTDYTRKTELARTQHIFSKDPFQTIQEPPFILVQKVPDLHVIAPGHAELNLKVLVSKLNEELRAGGWAVKHTQWPRDLTY